MAQWEYVKGSEADFREAPEWATVVIKSPGTERLSFEEDVRTVRGNRWKYVSDKETLEYANCSGNRFKNIIAERRKVDDLQSRVNDANLGDALKEMFRDAPCDDFYDKYNRPCKGVTIDVYDVLVAFNVTNPALQHLIKKALAVGQRGHKDKNEDLNDILASAKRAIELEERNK